VQAGVKAQGKMPRNNITMKCTQKQYHNDEHPKAIASDECLEATTPGGASLHVATKSINTHSKKKKSRKKKHT